MAETDPAKWEEVLPDFAPVSDAFPVDSTTINSSAIARAPDAVLRTAPVGAPMSEIARAGVDLTGYVLLMIAGFLLVALAGTCASEVNAANRSAAVTAALASAITTRPAPSRPATADTTAAASSPDTTALSLQLALARADSGTARFVLAHLAEERAAARAFHVSVLQMVLLNVLLPVLTALLGYVFGSSRRE